MNEFLTIMKPTRILPQFLRHPANFCAAGAGALALLSWLSWCTIIQRTEDFNFSCLTLFACLAGSLALLSCGIFLNNRNPLPAQPVHSRSSLGESIELSPVPRLYFEQTSLAVIEWDALFRVIHWNPAAERLFGYKAEEAVGQFVTFFVPPHAEEERKQILLNLSVKQDALSIVNKMRTKDGRTVFCRWHNTPLVNAEGKLLGVLSLCEEIPDRRHDEELERLAAIVHNCSELVMTTTSEGKMIFLNEPGCEILGITPYTVHKHRFADIVAESLRETVDREIWPRLLRGETWKGEMQFRNLQTSKLHDVQTAFFCIRDPHMHESHQVAILALDITECKRAEASIRDKDRKLHQFFENASDMLWIINFSGKTTFISSSVKQLLGYEPAEFGRLTFKDYLTPASAQFALNRIDRAIAAMRPGQMLEPETFELEYRRKDGTLFWGEVHCNGSYDERGGLVGIQGITRDLGKRKRTEESLRKSEERDRKSFESKAEEIPIQHLESILNLL